MKKAKTKTFHFSATYMREKQPFKKLIVQLPNDVAKQQQEKIEELEEKISYYEKRKQEESDFTGSTNDR